MKNSRKHKNIPPSALYLAVLAAFPLLAGSAWSQTIVSADTPSATRVGGNGATIFDIANPNAHGLSHNRLNRFDVNSAGAVVNNAMASSNTTVAGSVAANPRLSQSASTVLADVMGSGRSQLAGTLELAGPSAHFVLANPYGIACSGCSFLNFKSNVDLVAGQARVDPGTSALSYANVSGNVQVDGAGLRSDAARTRLHGGSVSVQGPVNAAGEVVVEAFATDAQGLRTATAGQVALSGRAMHADRITISAPGTGSNVNVEQPLQGTQGVGLDSGGPLRVAAGVESEKGDVRMSGTAVGVEKVRVVAGKDIAVRAQDATFRSSHLLAGNDIAVEASNNIISVASEGTGFDIVTTPVAQTVARSVKDKFELNLSHTFFIDTKTGEVRPAGVVKSGGSLTDAAQELYDAMKESSSEISRTWITTITESQKTESTQKVDRPVFEAGGKLLRTAGGQIVDQATNLTAAGDIEQRATALTDTTFSTPFREEQQQTTKTHETTAGIEVRGFFPGGFLKYKLETTRQDTQGNGQREVGSVYNAGRHLLSHTSGDTSLKASRITALGNADFRARQLQFDALRSTEEQTITTDRGSGEIKFSGGFFWADGTGRVEGTLGHGKAQLVTYAPTQLQVQGNYWATSGQGQRYQGTQLRVGQSAEIRAGGPLRWDALENTKTAMGVATTLGASAGGGMDFGGFWVRVGADGKVALDEERRTDTVAGLIDAVGGATLISDGDLVLTGTDIKARGADLRLQAGGSLQHNTLQSQSERTVSSGKGEGSAEFRLGWSSIPTLTLTVGGRFDQEHAKDTTRTPGTLSAAGSLHLTSGGPMTLQGSTLNAGQAVNLKTAQGLRYEAAESEREHRAGNLEGKVELSIGSSLGFDFTFGGGLAGSKGTSAQRGVVRAQRIDIDSDGTAHFVGTDMRATESARLRAAQGLNMESARKTYLGGSAEGHIKLGASIGLGSTPSFVPSFGFDFKAGGRSLNINHNAVLSGPRVEVLVPSGGVTLAGGTVQSPQLVTQITGPVTVTPREDHALGGGFDFSFGQKLLTEQGTSATVIPRLIFRIEDDQDVRWYRAGGGLKVDLPTGTSIGFGGYVETAPVTQKPSGLFNKEVL